MKNRFVIICPSFNNEEWVETHIESIKCQTYDNYKVIYINDNSTDNTENVLLPLIENDNRFIYIKNESNQGALKNSLLKCRTPQSQSFVPQIIQKTKVDLALVGQSILKMIRERNFQQHS